MKQPYFINPDIDALPEATGEERTRLIRHIAANVGDENALRTIVGIEPEEFARLYPDMSASVPSTEDTISSFIERFASGKTKKTTEIEDIVGAPAVDYATLLEKEASITSVRNSETPQPQNSGTVQSVNPASSQHQNTESTQLSEELFKLMVKNKNYGKALEIITELSLNNPKKSVYFAYQIRFLKKLIANQGIKPQK